MKGALHRLYPLEKPPQLFSSRLTPDLGQRLSSPPAPIVRERLFLAG
jgi:hypothetical protein